MHVDTAHEGGRLITCTSTILEPLLVILERIYVCNVMQQRWDSNHSPNTELKSELNSWKKFWYWYWYWLGICYVTLIPRNFSFKSDLPLACDVKMVLQ